MQIAGKACSDSTAPLVLRRPSGVERRGLIPLAAISSHATHAQAPNLFATVPICATGARIIVTLLAALRRYDLKRGAAAVGGGEAMANAIGQLDGPGGTI